MEMTLRAAVVSKYGNAQKFADAIGWSGRKARDIVSGRQEPNNRDMIQMARVLGIQSAEEFCRLFLPEMTTMWS